MATSRTEDALLTADEQRIVDQLQTAARTKQLLPGVDPVRLLQETRSPRLRDAAALALLDLGDPRTAELLVPLIASSDTLGHRGTLLYVLNELEADVPLDILIDVLISGSYEAREETLMLLEHTQASDAERLRARTALDSLKRSKDKALAAAASEAIARLKRR